MSGLIFSSGQQSYTAGNDPILLDSNLDLDFDGSNGETFDSATVQITNFQAGDVLGVINPLDSSFTNSNSVDVGGKTYTLSYDGAGLLTISGSATVAEYEVALQQVAFQNSNSGADTTTRDIKFSLNATGLDSDNGRFYQFIENDGISWTDAKTAAESLTNFGRQGYLATITSQAEQDIIIDDVKGNGWIGGSDAETEGEWKWVTGPEAGTTFWSGNGTAGAPVNNEYNNWKRIVNPGDPNDASQLEPNDNNGVEDYAHVIGNPAAGTLGEWNDINDTETNVDFKSQGYLVEYGGSQGDPTLSFTNNIAVNFTSAPSSMNWEVKAVEDFGADFKADILWYESTTGQVDLWEMDGTTETKSTIATVAPSSGWMIADAGDSNGDDKADILWYNNTSGEVGLWEMDGATPTNQNVIGVTVDPTLGWQITDMADVDGDGNSDIIWRNGTTGENGIWRLDGQQVLEYKTIHTVTDADWKIAGAADFDGDGKEDLLWRNTNAGDVSGNYPSKNAIWLMDGTEVKEYSYIPNVDSGDWMVAGADDFNGDGKGDIAWRNGTTGENAIWTMDGTSVEEFSSIDPVAAGWNIVGTGDFNKDSNADLMFRNGSTGENAIWQMDGAVPLDQSFIDPLPMPVVV
ncbi:MAG: FG-GAP-like repeat-containing protein [Cyanobacteria bacterium P01_A01_bin.84]